MLPQEISQAPTGDLPGSHWRSAGFLQDYTGYCSSQSCVRSFWTSLGSILQHNTPRHNRVPSQKKDSKPPNHSINKYVVQVQIKPCLGT